MGDEDRAPGPRFSMSLTQKPESGLKLAEVVEFIGEPWEKFKDISRFSKFHAKFLGKSMVEEEREWLNLKTQSPDHFTDDVIMDHGYDEDTDDTDADTDDEFIMSSTSTQTLFRTSRRSGSVLFIFVSTSTQSRNMTSVTNAIRPKQLSSPAILELVSAFVYIFRTPFDRPWRQECVLTVYATSTPCRKETGHMV